ncbi:MAG: ATP-binding cassette domain-containing protein [Planctomycetes bacterium]|nr:ATP-binding cassette domain-containing protein [Planctomycetota bacterium]
MNSRKGEYAVVMLIELEKVSKNIGRRPVFNGLSLKVANGEFLLVTGPNGSGKTLLLFLLAGVLRPDRGELRRSREIGATAFAPDRGGLDDFLSVRANIQPWCASKTAVDREVERWGLGDLGGELVERLSSGQRRRTVLARLFAREEARLLLLDEPLNGLDDAHRDILLRAMKEALGRGQTLVVCSHESDYFESLGPRTVKLGI